MRLSAPAPACAPRLRSTHRRPAALPPTTPDTRVETAFRELFGTSPAMERVLASYTRAESGPPYECLHAGLGLQQASSYIEGLSARPWLEVDAAKGEAGHAWAAALQPHWQAIAAEVQSASARGVERKGSNVWAPAARADGAAYGAEWRTLVLQDRGRWDPTNAALFPTTVRLVRDVVQAPSLECFFARQAAGSGIKAHSDNCNFIHTAHLGLQVAPPTAEAAAWLQVGAERRRWAEGEWLVFDTSFEHSTMNETTSDRLVLLLRFWHPELGAAERVAVQWLFDAADDDSTQGLKAATRAAEKRMAKRSGAGAAKGFGR